MNRVGSRGQQQKSITLISTDKLMERSEANKPINLKKGHAMLIINEKVLNSELNLAGSLKQ